MTYKSKDGHVQKISVEWGRKDVTSVFRDSYAGGGTEPPTESEIDLILERTENLFNNGIGINENVLPWHVDSVLQERTAKA